MSRTVLVTGAGGQLGKALIATAPPDITLESSDITELDISDPVTVAEVCGQLAPDVIVNAAAYTAVDRAEEDPAAAYAVNRDGVSHLAAAAAACGARLVQVSTDFVFSGDQGHPYRPDDRPRPLGVYGASKLAGEEVLRQSAAPGWLILRTAWVYSADGKNFAKTMLQLMRQGQPLRVVGDQVGTPTWTAGLAGAIWRAIENGLSGVYHWTDAGVASWYDFAVAIQEEALAAGLLRAPVTIAPIRSEDYPTAARRPAYSVLDKTATWHDLALTAPHWRESLRAMLGELAARSQPFD
jgi:dTDP-4-dehydrorhamnose reductase